ncbi:hypothetical protein V5799_030055 [Amblyomma americanum]|uniref:Peptidase M13 C-terminal domain-containing protein n=1 Tax=Amblyomma americanum TaxID=6943 RepID=A0AAQ4EPH2_AMBAM
MQQWHSTYNSVWGRQTDAAVGTDAEYYDDNVSDPYQNAAGPAGAATEVGSGESKSHAVWFLVAGMVAVFLLLLALNLFILSNVGSDWEHANRPPDTPDTTLASYLSQGQSRRERGAGERTCSTRACVAAAANVSLDAAANPCNDFFGHVCNNWIRGASEARFYGERVAPASLSASQTVFAWMQDKMVNEHLALNEPEQFADARWQTGLLSTRCRLVLREEETVATDQGESDEDGAETGPEATLQVPPAALDLVWATDPSTGMLQVARIGVRSYEPVLRHLFRWLQQQQRASSLRRPERSGCSSWEASPERLDAALESRALSLALRAYLAWPHASELVLPGLEHLGPEQLFFVFYALNQCEANGPDVEQLLASKYKRRDGAARPGRAAWVNGVTSTNEDFARAFQCPPPPKQPNPFRDCSTAVGAAHGGRT